MSNFQSSPLPPLHACHMYHAAYITSNVTLVVYYSTYMTHL